MIFHVLCLHRGGVGMAPEAEFRPAGPISLRFLTSPRDVLLYLMPEDVIIRPLA